MRPLHIKNPRRPFTAARDAAGVPHVKAPNWLDALYGLGYLHALDRGTQLLFARSMASGKGSEEITDSEELRETDMFFRKAGLYLRLEEEVRALDAAVRLQLSTYCEGVNDGLLWNGRTLPMWATGYQPQPWNEEAILLVGQLLSFGGLAVSQLQNERMLIELIHAGVSEEGLRDLFSPRLDDVDFDLIRQVNISNQLSDEALELITDLPRLAGSNAWAVSPQKSATGGAILAADPHLEVNRLPAIWYEAVLQWEDDFVMGATLPGCPLFAVARNRHVAWGVTYMKGDTADYFIEDCRAGGETGWQFRRGDQWNDFHVRDELLHHKGGEPEKLRLYESPQGTLDTDPNEFGPGYHLAINWSGRYPGSGRAIGSWLEVIAAKSTADAMNVVQHCTQPTLCWVFADNQGHIGLQTCGRFPVRGGGYTGLTPIPAWEEENHWNGWHPAEILPSAYDPVEGFVSTANEEVNPLDMPLLVTQILTDYRKRRIVERLNEISLTNVEEMQRLQYDLVSTQAKKLLEVFLPCLEEGPLKEKLGNWDFRYTPQSLEATLFQRLYRNVLVGILGREGGIGWRRLLYLSSRVGFSNMMVAGVDRMLLQENSFWWKDQNKTEIIRQAGRQVNVEKAEPWSAVNNFHFADRFFGSHQVGRLLGFASRRYPMPGCHATIFQGHVLVTATRETTFAPSYHFVTDLSTHEAWSNLPGGPSESRFSRYYNSDVSRWRNGEYKKLALLK